MPRLTKRIVDSAVPGEKDQFLWDTDLRGFGLRIKPSGTKSYVLQYRTLHGRTRRMSLGRHGVLTPEEARQRARLLLADVAKGGDPAQERATERKALTVAELVGLYLAEGPAEKPNKKPSSWKTDATNLRCHVLPLLGSRIAKALTPADITRWHADVAEGRVRADRRTGFRGRSIVRGGRGTAARALAVLAAALEFGVRRGHLAANPAKNVKPHKPQRRERFLSAEEVGRLAETLNKLEQSGANAVPINIIRLLLLTGCRRDEIRTLKWEYVDLERGFLRLPESKTGAKTVPLGAPALEILAALPRESEYVFPAQRAGATGCFTGLQKFWERVRADAGLHDVRLHDLRHSFASFAVAGGAGLYLVGKILGHRQARTTEVYAHVADDPLRTVADHTARRIAAAMQHDQGEVVSLLSVQKPLRAK